MIAVPTPGSEGPAALEAHYDYLERAWPVEDRASDYARLVVPTGNDRAPFHRCFRLKEAYSVGLLDQLVKDCGDDSTKLSSVFDPFCGSGTTLLSALEMAADGGPMEVVGVERNPVLELVAYAKVQGYLRGAKLAAQVRSSLPSFRRRYRYHLRRSPITPSSTLNNPSFFSASNTQSLLALGRAARSEPDPAVRAVLQVGLAGSVEASGRLRRDGRALRYAPTREPGEPVNIFDGNMHMMLQDLESRDPAPKELRGAVFGGDARHRLPAPPPQDGYDAIIFSPPYPNNIDYTEVYKLEAWSLGFWAGAKDMRRQRLKTLRSHPSVLFPDSYEFHKASSSSAVVSLVDPILQAIPAGDRYSRGRQQLVCGYVDDMLAVLSRCRGMIASSGFLVYVVGNSVHGTAEGKFVIAADLLLARCGELTGWTVDEVRVARRLHRRNSDSKYLRESVVILRPC